MNDAHKFSVLNDTSREYLENDEEARRAYLDLLTYLHEQVHAAVAGRSVTPLDAEHVDYGLGELKYHFPTSRQIGKAARQNIAAGHKFAREIPAVLGGKKTSELENAAHAFLAAVLTEYDSIRIIACKERVS